MAGSSHAAIIGVALPVKNPPGTPFLAPEAALPSPWVSYQLSLQSTAGELIQAIDVSITGNKLHQRWLDADFDGITDPTPRGAASNGRGDSVITAPANAPFGLPATETNNKTGSPLTGVPGVAEYGLGNLSGAWAIPGQASTFANIAYIVFNSHDFDGGLQITVKAADPTGAQYPTLSTSDFGSLFCLGCSPPQAGDDVINNVDANVPGLIDRQLTIQSSLEGGSVSLTNFAFDSFTPPPGGSGMGPANAASLDSPTRKFTWNTIGSPLGTYKWTYTAGNVWGSDPGSITVNITVPEPATFSLLGLSLIGLGFIRRRAA